MKCYAKQGWRDYTIYTILGTKTRAEDGSLPAADEKTVFVVFSGIPLFYVPDFLDYKQKQSAAEKKAAYKKRKVAY